jgi:ApaG protein
MFLMNQEHVSITPMPKYQLTVQVVPQFLPDQSAPDEGLFVFAYTITIINTGDRYRLK